MSIHRGIDGSEPIRSEPVTRLAGVETERRAVRSWRLATGTLACPACDAPVFAGNAPLLPSDALGCPVCRHEAAVRDFLSLSQPTRPARVTVRVTERVPSA